MSHRNKRQFIFIVALLFTVIAAGPDGRADKDGNGVLRFYREIISPVDGDRCPMHPSSSEYAARAIEKHGLVLGWIMACDRIQRCGRDTVTLAPKVLINNEPHAHDPVEANDFWWFNRERPE